MNSPERKETPETGISDGQEKMNQKGQEREKNQQPFLCPKGSQAHHVIN